MSSLLVFFALACVSPDEVNDIADRDGDGFGAVEAGCATCTDCDDDDATVHPDAAEVCNGIDDDCDGDVDSTAPDLMTFYIDRDADGFGDLGSPIDDCEAPQGYVDNSADCDDTNGARKPGADETCNDLDDDCDGEVDEEPVDGVLNWFDGDWDGFTVGEAVITCDYIGAPYTDAWSDPDDCDDANPDVNPEETETCNGIDDDCDGDVDEGC